jgi:hypothetical protein
MSQVAEGGHRGYETGLVEQHPDSDLWLKFAVPCGILETVDFLRERPPSTGHHRTAPMSHLWRQCRHI